MLWAGYFGLVSRLNNVNKPQWMLLSRLWYFSWMTVRRNMKTIADVKSLSILKMKLNLSEIIKTVLSIIKCWEKTSIQWPIGQNNEITDAPKYVAMAECLHHRQHWVHILASTRSHLCQIEKSPLNRGNGWRYNLPLIYNTVWISVPKKFKAHSHIETWASDW